MTPIAAVKMIAGVIMTAIGIGIAFATTIVIVFVIATGNIVGMTVIGIVTIVTIATIAGMVGTGGFNAPATSLGLRAQIEG
jgi:hypothetical protein